MPKNFVFKKNFIRDYEEYLLERLKDARRGDTAIVWDESYFFKSIFRSNLHLKVDVDEGVASQVIQKSLGALLNNELLKLSDFEEKCQELYEAHIQKNIYQFEVISGMYFGGKNPFQSIVYKDIKFRFLPINSPKIIPHIDLIKEKFPGKKVERPLIKSICCTVQERDFDLAFKKVEAALSEIRAVMNLCTGSGTQMAMIYRGTGFGKSKIRESEFHSVRSLTDPEVFEVYYKPDWVKPKSAHTFPDDDIKIASNIKKVIRRLNVGQRFSDRVFDMLQIYLDALDENSARNAYIKMWNVLEIGTLIEPGQSHNEIVKRLLKLCKTEHVTHAELVLDAVKNIRNTAVHKNQNIKGDLAQYYFRELNAYARFLILYYINNPHHFKSEDEFIQFLNLERNADKLQDRLSVINQAIKYRKVNP